MRIDELKRIAEENDYKFYKSLEYKTITLTREISVDGFITNHITINSITKNQVFIGNGHCDEKDLNMIKASVEFAETHPEDREEEKKFYLKHRWIKSETFIDYENFLNYNNSANYAIISDKDSIGAIKTQFTLKEIEEIKKKFDTDLADFELVELEDEN